MSTFSAREAQQELLFHWSFFQDSSSDISDSDTEGVAMQEEEALPSTRLKGAFPCPLRNGAVVKGSHTIIQEGEMVKVGASKSPRELPKIVNTKLQREEAVEGAGAEPPEAVATVVSVDSIDSGIRKLAFDIFRVNTSKITLP